MPTGAKPRVLVVAGPTGVGKTSFALRVAERTGAHVVNADSRQVYRFMDIGTAKSSPREQAAVPHHGLDVVLPDQTWTLAQQQRLTYSTLDLLAGCGIVAMLVGGTGQYIRAAVEGWQVPEVAPDAGLRAQLEERARVLGVPVLHKELEARDPRAAARIMPTDLRRTVRALEVWYATGQRLSELQATRPPDFDFRIVGLTVERATLYAAVDERVERMVQEGLLEEVRGLLRAGYGWQYPAMRSIGYGELEPYFDGAQPLDACLDRIRFSTHALIRRQYVWFRRLTDVHWVDVSERTALDVAVQSAAEWLVDRQPIQPEHGL